MTEGFDIDILRFGFADVIRNKTWLDATPYPQIHSGRDAAQLCVS